MSIEFAEQYQCACMVLDGSEEPDDVIEHCLEIGAVYLQGEGDEFCVRFPDRPQELYTECALRRSLPAKRR